MHTTNRLFPPQDLASELYSNAKDICESTEVTQEHGCELACQLAHALIDQASALLNSTESAHEALCLLDGAHEIVGEIQTKFRVQSIGQSEESPISDVRRNLEEKVQI